MKKLVYFTVIVSIVSLSLSCTAAEQSGLWQAYERYFVNAKYVDLTYPFEPDMPVWPGFGNAEFMPTKAGADLGSYASKGDVYTYEDHGFVATSYNLTTDQYGTQLDPPAHWAPEGATISDIPATYAIRPLVVIDIHEKVAENTGYHLTVQDIKDWEKEYGTIPEGSVVMVRSDYYKGWKTNPDFAAKPFPGVNLDAAKFLHLQRDILFHGHEPLDSDTTATLVTEDWLLHNQYCQAEGVMNLDKVPEKGALIAIGFAKPKNGSGGYARYIAICPPDWDYGVSIKEDLGAPLPTFDDLHWDEEAGMRVR